MTGPHLTPEREADYREWLAKDPRYFATRARDILAALDAEREAHNLTRTALVTGTELLTIAMRHVDREHGFSDLYTRIDTHIIEAQLVLGLATAEADKPHHGTDGR